MGSHNKSSLAQSRAARPPLAPADEDAGAQHLVRLSGRGFVLVTMLTVGADAVAQIHAHRTVWERGSVLGAAERARPLGVGVDVFGELEFFVGDARSQHEFHPHAFTRGLMRHERVRLLEAIADILQRWNEI
jgi:hypothetical protein